jgi:hypothetical protein
MFERRECIDSNGSLCWLSIASIGALRWIGALQTSQVKRHWYNEPPQWYELHITDWHYRLACWKYDEHARGIGDNKRNSFEILHVILHLDITQTVVILHISHAFYLEKEESGLLRPSWIRRRIIMQQKDSVILKYHCWYPATIVFGCLFSAVGKTCSVYLCTRLNWCR